MADERVAEAQMRAYESRQPCPRCATTQALAYEKNGQTLVRCARCRDYLYSAPKHETGLSPRSVQVAHTALQPRTKSFIKERAMARCEMCGSGPEHGAILNASHILSVKEGLELGCSIEELNDPENLACLCEECNSGMGARSFSARLYVRLLKARHAYLEAAKRSGN